MNQNTYDKKAGRGFGYANALLQFVNSTNGSYISFFITDVCMISAANLGVISSVAGIATVAATFIWAIILQYVNLKQGRYRGWLVILAVLICAGFVGLYTNWGLSETVSVALLIAAYVLVNFGISGIGIASMGLMTKVGNTATARADILSFQNITHCVARVISAAIVLPIVRFVGGSDTAGTGYTFYFGVFSFITVFGYIYLSKVTKSHDPYDPNFKAGTVVKPKDMLRAVASNKDLLILFVSNTAYDILNICRVFSAVYFFRYIVGNMEMYVLYNIIDPFGSAIGAAMSKFVVAKFDKTRVIFPLFLVNAAILAMIAVFVSLGIINGYLFITLAFLAGLINTIQRSYNSSLYMDCAEISYNKTGEDITPVCVSLGSLPFKFAFSFSGTIVAAVLAATGYAAGEVLTASAVRGIVLCYSILPAIGLLIFAFSTRFLLKLDVKTIDRIMEENAARKAAKQAELESRSQN